MDMIFDFDHRQGITNVRFDGLDGTEDVTSVKDAVSRTLQIRNPCVTFSEDVHLGKYDKVPDAEYNRMLESIKHLSSLWHFTGTPEDAPPKFEMNALMLLANALDALSQFNVQYQMP